MVVKECMLLVVHSLVFMVNSQSTIDLSNPIWIKDGYSDEGTDSSFGYTVSLLNNNVFESTKQASSAATGWVLIGAPKGNHIHNPEQPPPPPTKEPGVLWRCSLGSSDEVCEIINVQNPHSQSRPNCYSHQFHNRCPWLVNQNESWMGGSMSVSTAKSFRSQQGGVVTCAHRWQRSRRHYDNIPEADFVNGICYWLPQKSLSSSVDDINSAAVSLLPLVDENKRYYMVRSNFQQVQDYEYYYGEAGFSSHLTEDNQLILGAPGVHTWSGSVIYYDNPNNPKAVPNILPLGYYSNQAVRILDLYGYSITSGNFFGSSNIIFAAGAPRSNNLLGSVILFGKEYNSAIYLYDITLSGTQLGSYFGFTLCAIDIDGDKDKTDELFVGAPFSSLPENDNLAIQGKGDQGCVKIYSFQRKGLVPDTICAKEDAVGARFGSAIAALGDINNDKLNDFAVGAPGENDGQGAVYIYHGRKFPFSKDTTPNQIIRASEIVTGLKSQNYWKPLGFGSSLHGGVDIDGNGTPDLVIGSYLNKSAVVLRTRPTAQIRTDMTFLILGRKAEKFSRDYKEFEIKYCISFRITPQPRHAAELELWTSIAVDKIYKRFSIPKDDRKKEVNSNFKTEFLTKVTGGKSNCISLTVKRNEEGFEPDIPISKLQIPVEAQVWYNATANLPVKTISYSIEKTSNYDKPRVVVSGSDNTRKFKNFCTYCPLSTKSQLLVESLSIENDDCKKTGTPECESELKFHDITLKGKDVILSDKNNQFPFVIGSSKYLTLLIKVRNDGETAYNPIVEMKALFDDEIRPIRKNECNLDSDSKDPLQKIFQCKLGRPLHRSSKPITQEMVIDVSSLYAKSVSKFFSISINAYPKDKTKISHSISIEMKAEAKVQLTGSTNDRQASISDTSHINIVHTYTASLKGISPIDSVKMTFFLPVNFTKTGKQTQTLISVSKPSSIVCTPILGSFNEWTKQMDSTPSSNSTNAILVRNKRDTKPASFGQKDTLVVNCEKPWTCMKVSCETKLPADGSVKVEFAMHIDNKVARSILKAEHKKMVVESTGNIGIFSEQDKDYKKVASSYTTVTIQAQEDFPVWIAIVAGIGGLILLLLITLGLARCGFFRRKTKEDLQALKSKTENDALLGEKIPMQINTNDDDSDSD